jgi:hypothetical protein
VAGHPLQRRGQPVEMPRCPEHWTGRLNNTLKSLVIGYDPIAISECAQRSLEIIRSFRNGS